MSSISIVAALALSALAPAETPRTPWGDPDLSGMWVNNTATPLERPDAFQGKETLTDEELQELKRKAAEVLDGGDAFFADDFVTAAVDKGTEYRSFDQKTGNYNQFWLAEREFDNRTSLIVDPPDGRIPELSPEGRARVEKEARGFLGIDPAGPEDLSDQVRCITYGVPNILAGYNSLFQILQTKDYVVIFQELIHDARIIPIDGRPHLPERIRQWHGDSRGRWEGETLVVETTNFSPKSNFHGSAENLHLVERFTRADAGTISYELEIEDPSTFASPWTIRIPLRATTDPIFEYACHEGNVAMEGILKGARAKESAPPDERRK
jgi:hypothetical protein